MLHKLLGAKSQVFVVEPGAKVEVRYEAPYFVLDDRRLTAESTAAHILEPFVEERKRLKKPLVARWKGDQIEVVLERQNPDRVYRFRVHPTRHTVAWSEELTKDPDPRLPRMAPNWSRTFASPWPAKTGHASLSAAWLPEGVLFLLGDWITWIEPETGKVRGEWPLPGKPGTRVTVELLALVEQGVLGSYRVFENEKPIIAGMLLLKMEEQPRWKLIPSRKGSVNVTEPVEPTSSRIVMETRVHAGEDYLLSRAQWVVDLQENTSYTALLGGPPLDQEADRCLSLLPELPNRLDFAPQDKLVVGSNPLMKLTALPAFKPLDASPKLVLRGAIWNGTALAYELRPDSLVLHGWQNPELGWAVCRACRQRLPARVYHCPCGMPWKP